MSLYESIIMYPYIIKYLEHEFQVIIQFNETN